MGRSVNSVKTVAVYMMIGAFLGIAMASFIVPPALAWYNKAGDIAPGKPVETLCNLPEIIRYTSSRVLRGQLIGAAVGALLFLFPGVIAARRRHEAGGSSPTV